ncbi:MAG: cytochrome bd-I oxidase subunit CydX [Pseudomonadota bacterium]|nr:cytochrome bd-I oxidase subunit CydX [Thermithiobacillus tepidarius]
MWYFAWILGVTMAILLAVLNAMWSELLGSDENLDAAPEYPDLDRRP